MKRHILWGLVALLTMAGCYCGYRYYSETYLPEKHIADADRLQNALFERIKPELASTEQAPACSTADSAVQETAAETSEAQADPLAELLACNAEAVGWITVSGTNIDFPIVQTQDNAFYLHHGFDQQYNYDLGCPFLDYRCMGDFSGYNSVVYAHHMTKRRMFADIALFKDSEFMQSCPYGILLTENGQHTVRFFAYLTVPSDSQLYQTEFSSQQEWEVYLDMLFLQASYTRSYSLEELKALENPHILLLSTCTFEYQEARGVLAGVIE